MDQLPNSYFRVNKPPLAVLLVLAMFLVVVAFSWVLSSQLNAADTAHHIGTQIVIQYLLGFALMFAVWRMTPAQPSANWLTLILVTGVLARIILIFIEPYSSSDVSRYLFDGRILLEGIDPYRIAHDATILQEMRAEWMPPEEHTKYTTLYPPLALALYAIAASAGVHYALYAWKLLTAIANLALCCLGFKVLQKAGRLQHLALIALSPLLIFESGESAHVDIFSALSVLAAIFAWQHQRLRLVGIFIGIGACIKILPAILLLPLVLFTRDTRARLQLISGAALTCLGIYATAFLSGLLPVGSISVFFVKWRASSPLFTWLEPHLSGDGMLYLVITTITLGLLILSVLCFHRKRNNSDYQLAIMQATLALPILISPVVFPWYLMPLAVIFAVRPNFPVALWMLTLPISYEVLNLFLCRGTWNPSSWPTHLIGAAIFIGILLSVCWRNNATIPTPITS